MLRYFYKLTFLPKLPQAHAISDAPYNFQGNFFLISEKKYHLIDFQIKNDIFFPNEDVHVMNPINVYLTDDQIENLKTFYSTSLHFYYRFNSKQFEELNVIIVPIISIAGESELFSTLQWINDFQDSIQIKEIYFDLLRKHDKKNDGKKLQLSIYENGEKIEKFLRFISTIDSPSIEEFIESTQIVNEQEISKRELTLYIVALRFQEKIINRLIWSELKNLHSASGRNYYQYYIGLLVSFSSHSDQIISDEKNITYSEYYEKKHTITNLDATLPLLELVPLRMRYLSEKELYNELTQYPQSFNRFHKLISDLLINRKLVTDVCQRIPPDYIFRPNTNQTNLVKIPFEALRTKYFPLFAGSVIHQLTQITNQIKPVSVGQLNPSDSAALAATRIEELLRYKFKNLSYLSEALTDPSYPSKHANLHSYQRLEYLGDCVLDVTTTFAIFNANERASESEMTFLKHALVSNRTFASICVAMGLNEFVVSAKKEMYTDRAKCSADIFESVFGAIFRDSDLLTCFAVYKTVVLKYLDIFKRAVSNLKYGRETLRYIVESHESTFGRLFVNHKFFNSDRLLNSEDIVRRLGIGDGPDDPRIDPRVFTMAFRHSSVSQTDYDSYERLEFIGDIVVKMSIGVVLFFSFPTAADSGLSTSSSYYKSNDVLGRVALKMGLDDLFIASDHVRESMRLNADDASDVTISISKIYGDLFESSTAAISICFGLRTAFQFVQKNVLGSEIVNRPDNPTIDPVSSVNIISQKCFQAKPVFHVWEFMGTMHAYISIKRAQLPFIGESIERNKALQNVSRLFVEESRKNPMLITEIDELIRQNEINDNENTESSFEVICNNNIKI